MSNPARIEELEGPFNKLIAERMRELGFERLEQFAEYAHIGEATLYSLVLGRRTMSGARTRPRLDTLVALSHALNRPLGELAEMAAPDGFVADDAEMTTLAAKRRALALKVDVAGWVGAGPAQDEESYERPIWVEAAFARGKNLRAFRVRGDSMAAGKRPILDGDRVIVDLDNPGSNTDSVVARLKDGSYVCKMLKVDQFGKSLQSRNPEATNGTPSFIPAEEVDQIIGKVIRVVSDDTEKTDQQPQSRTSLREGS